MPQTRPAEISDGVSLSDKLAGEMGAFIAENGTINACLSAVVFESPPNPEGVAIPSSEDKFFAGAAEQFRLPAIGISAAAVMSVKESLRDFIAVLCDPPNWFINFQSSPLPEFHG